MTLFGKKYYVLFLVSFVFWGSLFFGGAALAQSDDLIVEFQNGADKPLFNEVNFLPGESVSRWAEVANNSGQVQKVAVEAINISNPVIDPGTGELFGDILTLKIEDGSATFYQGTFSDFFSAGEFYLRDINPGSSLRFYFTAFFEDSAENKFQGKNLGFDMLIGFQGAESENFQEEENGEGETPAGLSIQGPYAFNISTSQATIEWSTSYKSTSRVVYGTTPGVFDLNNPPDYGYAFSSSEKDNDWPISENGVLNHQVFLNGLSAGTTYYYRAISHASPPSITQEKSFTTLGLILIGDSRSDDNNDDDEDDGEDDDDEEDNNENLINNRLAVNAGSSFSGEGGLSDVAAENSASDLSDSEGSPESDKNNGEVAGEYENICKGQAVWIWILSLIVYAVLFNFNNFYGEQKKEKIRWFWETFYTIAALLIWWLFDQCHINIWFPWLVIIIGVLSYGYYLRGMKKESTKTE